ncbi:MAG: transcriptional regulator [Ahrensia sp.]|nr:transcriptional regulator [Ahrensia sp.]
METHRRKQVTVICEAPVAGRVTRVLDKIPVSGYTVIPALSGAGREGHWEREGLVGDVGRMVVIISVMSEGQAAESLEAIYQTIEPQMGIVTVSNVEVLRPERF